MFGSTKGPRPLIFWVRLAGIGVFILSAIYGVWLSGWIGLIVPAAAVIALAMGAIAFAILSFAIWWIYEGIRRILRKGR
jgi:hypothetical protein